MGTKLTLTMGFLVTIAVLIMAYSGYTATQQAARQEASTKLESVARLQARQVKTLLQTINRDLLLKAQDQKTASALSRFTAAFAGLDSPLEDLQRRYIQENPHPAGAKDLMVSTGDGSPYDNVHKTYHRHYDALQDAMGYYDIFLFDTEGNLVYSVFKELDYATNIMTGQWKSSGLGEVFRQANALPSGQSSSFVDFAPYGPSADAPAAFIAAPVFDESGKLLGVLAYQMPVDAINQAVSDTVGLGPSAESFLVGSDRLMRTDSPATEINDILATSVESPAVFAGLRGEEGVLEYSIRQGTDVLGYFQPIEFLNTTWVIIVQEETSELFALVQSSLRTQIIVALTMLGITLAASFWMSRGFSKPLTRLNKSVLQVASGDYEAKIPDTDRKDEIGIIATALEDFRGSLVEADFVARDATFKTAGFEAADTAMLLTDAKLEIIGMNGAMEKLFLARAAEFSSDGAALCKEDLVGTDISSLTFLPNKVSEAIRNSSKLPFSDVMEIRDAHFQVTALGVHDKEGQEMGRVLEIDDVTEAMSTQALFNAIDAHQIRMEFALDRRLKSASPLLETLSGQTVSQLKRTPGSDLVNLESETGTPSEMWDSVERGQVATGRFRFNGAQGVVLLEGSLSPIPDHHGNATGFLLIAADVTAARREIERAEQLQNERNAAQAEVVDALRQGLVGLANGDLRVSLDGALSKDYDQLRIDFNQAVEKLGKAVENVVFTTHTIDDQSSDITSAVQELSRRTETQAATLEQSAMAIKQLTASVQASTESTDKVANASKQARVNAEDSSVIVRQAVTAMNEIEESSQKVSNIVSVIEDVAFQTNLLALNAGVEAARAGEAGQGFAVVASEVRALAQRCSDAASEITELIRTSGQQVERGVALVSNANNALEEIVNSVIEITDHVTKIASTSAEQSSGIEDINEAMTRLDQTTQQNAAMAEETAAASQVLAEEVKGLAVTTGHFQTPSRETSDPAQAQFHRAS